MRFVSAIMAVFVAVALIAAVLLIVPEAFQTGPPTPLLHMLLLGGLLLAGAVAVLLGARMKFLFVPWSIFLGAALAASFEEIEFFMRNGFADAAGDDYFPFAVAAFAAVGLALSLRAAERSFLPARSVDEAMRKAGGVCAIAAGLGGLLIARLAAAQFEYTSPILLAAVSALLATAGVATLLTSQVRLLAVAWGIALGTLLNTLFHELDTLRDPLAPVYATLYLVSTAVAAALGGLLLTMSARDEPDPPPHRR